MDWRRKGKFLRFLKLFYMCVCGGGGGGLRLKATVQKVFGKRTE